MYYITNLQGDVMYMVNSSGATVASYTYDPWGKALSADGSMAEINPLRYRGYYYDSETGFYYVSSRYYDPEIGRWINADNPTNLGADGTPIGYNLFAYCLNNPVLMEDTNGESATIAGAVIGGVLGLINGIASGGSLGQVLACTATGFLTGGAAGFIADLSVATCGVAGAIIISAAGGGLMGFANSMVSQGVLNDGKIDIKKAAFDGICGAVMGGLCTATGDMGKPVASGLREGIRYVNALVAAEETMIVTQPIAHSVSLLAFDVGASAVTGFGSWAYGLAYDYYHRSMSVY